MTKSFDLYEGNAPDECTNGVDDDEDGLFDCDDETCEGSPDCDEGDMESSDTSSGSDNG